MEKLRGMVVETYDQICLHPLRPVPGVGRGVRVAPAQGEEEGDPREVASHLGPRALEAGREPGLEGLVAKRVHGFGKEPLRVQGELEDLRVGGSVLVYCERQRGEATVEVRVALLSLLAHLPLVVADSPCGGVAEEEAVYHAVLHRAAHLA